MMTTQRVVTEDKVVTIETTVTEEDRYVDYTDLLDCVEIQHDDYPNCPWEDCDGYSHDKRRSGYYDHEDHLLYGSNVAKCGRDGEYILEFDSAVERDLDDTYRYYRSRGASKQVAFELVAQSRRARMEALVGWYVNGWESWYVCAEYNGYEAMGCGGIDDYDYADTEYRTELADELAHQLEADGFVVTGKPGISDTKRENIKARLKRNLAMFNTTGR